MRIRLAKEVSYKATVTYLFSTAQNTTTQHLIPTTPLTPKTTMPSKLGDSSNLQFLYACLESGQPKRIDFQEVAKEFGLSVPAARMRMRRLHDALGDKQLGEKQGGKVTKPKSGALGRKAKRVGKKSGAKEGLEVNWKGAEDADDDDEEDIAGGKVERRRGGELKKEESDDDQAWKTLPEAVEPGTSDEVHAQATMLSPPVAALHQDPLAAKPQTLHHHASLEVTNTVSFEEDNSNFLSFLDGNTYSSAHVALPQGQDDQAFLEDYQPYYLQ